MRISEPWKLEASAVRGAASILADDGACYVMDASRAQRLVRLWNAYVGIPTSKIPRKAVKEGSR